MTNDKLKPFPTDEFGYTVLTSQKKYEKCYFCNISILGNPWFTFIQDNNCSSHVLSVPICDSCSEKQISYFGKIIGNDKE